MNTNEIIDQLNKETNNKYSFVFKDATLSVENSTCLIEIYYKDGTILSGNDRASAEALVLDLLPEGFVYKVKFIKNVLSEDVIKIKIDEFFDKNMPSVVHTVKNLKQNQQGGFSLVLALEDRTFDYFNNKNGSNNLKDFLNTEFFTNFDIDLEKIKTIDEPEDEVYFDIPQTTESLAVDRFVEISGVEQFVGDIIQELPSYIKDVLGQEKQDVCVAGTVKFKTEHSYERKSKKELKPTDDPIDAMLAEPKLSYFYKWTLDGFTGKMKCLCFTNKNNIEAVQSLEDGEQIVVFGDVEKDKFGDGYTLKVKRISKCVLPDFFEEKIEYKQENKEYRYVFPEPVEMTAQVDLFGSLDEIVPPYLQNHDVVVFDFETTGLNVGAGDKIIEIGAVKIINGKIKEKFMCMVDPEMPIPEESTKIHGIVDADVQGAPKIEEAIQDFYKFTRGCVLSGHNVNFDYGFLNKFGRDNKYNFDNELLDTLTLAMKYVRGVKNYKLKTIAEKLGVTLDNAHRAVYDALATAEVLIKIAPSMEES